MPARAVSPGRQPGLSQSALSHTVSGLEAPLGLRLLATLAPRFADIEAELLDLTALRDRPAGTVRIAAVDHAADTLLLPALARLLPAYPDLHVEINTRYAMVDLAEQGSDAGVRLGEHLARDMVATRIGPGLRVLDDWCAPFAVCHLY